MDALEGSHHGYPSVISVAHSGNRGRPQIVFDPEFLAWAYNRRSISALARFLGVGRTTLRNALIDHEIIVPREVFNSPITPSLPSQTLLQPNDDMVNSTPETVFPTDNVLESHIPQHPPRDRQETTAQTSNPSQPPVVHTYYHHSTISDQDLDDLIVRLRSHFPRAGIRMMSGMLLRLGHRVQQARIRESLLRIDPVRRVFERIRIRRRTYTVAGPNALWHHDGQHG